MTAWPNTSDGASPLDLFTALIIVINRNRGCYHLDHSAAANAIAFTGTPNAVSFTATANAVSFTDAASAVSITDTATAFYFTDTTDF